MPLNPQNPAPVLSPELERLLRQVKMPHVRALAPELLATAKAQRWEPAIVLQGLLEEEVKGRTRSMTATRRKHAGFPTGKTLASWDPGLSTIPLPTQQALRTLEWVQQQENLVLCGPSGTGKSFFLEALGQQAVEEGRKVSWLNLEQLGTLVRSHRLDDTVSKAITKILAADIVV